MVVESAGLGRWRAGALERELPDNAPLRVGEAVKFVHHDGADLLEVEVFRVEQAIEEDFCDDDEDSRVGVLAAVARDQPHVGRLESPTDGRGLHFAELLLGQRDQRGGVVGRLAGMQGFEEGGLGDDRLARAGRRANKDSLFGGKPGIEGVFLDRIGLERKLLQVTLEELFARGCRVGHGKC